jgi:hypothetical protein
MDGHLTWRRPHSGCRHSPCFVSAVGASCPQDAPPFAPTKPTGGIAAGGGIAEAQDVS